jgi:hypothetical protein
MKRRLNLELVSFDMEVSTEDIVLVAWIIEICSLLASSQTARGTTALFPGRTTAAALSDRRTVLTGSMTAAMAAQDSRDDSASSPLLFEMDTARLLPAPSRRPVEIERRVGL